MISGYTVIRNAIKGDYCIKECIESLLPVCDEVVVGEASSNDGTSEMLTEWASKESKLRIVHQDWVQPVDDPKWFVKWINKTRAELKYPMQLMLDADEVLDSASYSILKDAQVGQCFWFSRLNFWKDARTLIAHGETCGHAVARFGPSSLFMPSDEIYGDGFHEGAEPEIRQRATYHDSLRIFHYGFLRNRQGMSEKMKVNLKAFFGTFDTRISRALLYPDVPWQTFFRHKRPYKSYSGHHPEHCLEWLRSRNAL